MENDFKQLCSLQEDTMDNTVKLTVLMFSDYVGVILELFD